jgi:hypothetical protein
MHWCLALAASMLGGFQIAPLDQPLASSSHIIYAPAGDLAAPSDASELGLLSRVFRVAGVPFGFEADETAPRETSGAAVEPHDVTARTLRDALDGFVTMDPRYEWRDVQGVFVVRTRTAWRDPRDALNRPAGDVDWPDLDPIALFNRVARLLYPDAPHDPFEGMLASRARPVTVQLRQGTVLDVLNAAARADGQLGWAVSYAAAGAPSRFTLTIGHFGSGPTFSWPNRPRGIS